MDLYLREILFITKIFVIIHGKIMEDQTGVIILGLERRCSHNVVMNHKV